jgi:hypothetical protein
MKTDKQVLEIFSKEVSESKDVVASFNMSQNSLDAMAWLTKRFGISNKRLFDAIWKNYDEVIINLIEKIPIDSKVERIKKSQRISRLSLKNLNELAKKYKMKRDAIVEITFISYKILHEQMLEERNDKHRKALKMIDKYWEKGELLEKRLVEILNEDDPILTRMSKIIVVIENLSTDIKDELENGILIDPEGI